MVRAPARSPGRALTWLIGIVLLIAAGVSAVVWYVRENPLAVYVASTRRSLAKSGLELRSLETAVGRLVYWEAGEGSTLVLLHGAGDQSGAFRGVADGLLEDGYRLVIPDIPGHGESEPAEGTLPMRVMYAGVEELLDEVAGDAPPILVGSSMGAWISMLYAHRRPERVERVIAVNGGPLVGDRPDLSLTPPDREAARRLMEAIRDPSSGPTPDYLLDDIVEQSAKGPIGRMTAELADLVAHLLEGRLGEVETPVDLIWGESDRLLSLAYAERMASQLPHVRLTTIPGCGHHPANECPEKLDEALRRVLQMEPPRAAQPPAEATKVER